MATTMTMTMMKMVVTVMVEVMMVAVMVMTKNDNDDLYDDLYDVHDNGLNLCLSLIYFPSAEGRLQMILIIC